MHKKDTHLTWDDIKFYLVNKEWKLMHHPFPTLAPPPTPRPKGGVGSPSNIFLFFYNRQ